MRMKMMRIVRIILAGVGTSLVLSYSQRL